MAACQVVSRRASKPNRPHPTSAPSSATHHCISTIATLLYCLLSRTVYAPSLSHTFTTPAANRLPVHTTHHKHTPNQFFVTPYTRFWPRTPSSCTLAAYNNATSMQPYTLISSGSFTPPSAETMHCFSFVIRDPPPPPSTQSSFEFRVIKLCPPVHSAASLLPPLQPIFLSAPVSAIFAVRQMFQPPPCPQCITSLQYRVLAFFDY
jgi:hypothetical protein